MTPQEALAAALRDHDHDGEDIEVPRFMFLAGCAERLLAALAAAGWTLAREEWSLCPTGYVPEDHRVGLCKCVAQPAPDPLREDPDEGPYCPHCGGTGFKDRRYRYTNEAKP